MPHWGGELHLGWVQGIIGREGQFRFEEASFTNRGFQFRDHAAQRLRTGIAVLQCICGAVSWSKISVHYPKPLGGEERTR